MNIIGPIPEHHFRNLNTLKKANSWYKRNINQYDPEIIERNIEVNLELQKEIFENIFDVSKKTNKRLAA